MSFPSTPAAHAKLFGGSLLVINTFSDTYPDDDPWVTNSYFIVPARAAQPLLKYYGLSEYKPDSGVYDLEGKHASLAESPPPDFKRILDPAQYTVRLHPAEYFGKHIYLRPTNTFLQAFEREDGGHVAINADYLDFITCENTPWRVPIGYGYRWQGSVELRQASGAGGTVGIFAERGHQHGGELSERGKWVPETWTSQGMKLMAAIMPVRIP